MHAEDPALGWIQDRGRHERSVDAAVRDRERPALELLDRQLAVARARGQLLNGALDLGESHSVGVPEDGDNEPARRPDRDPEVDEVVVDDLFPFDEGVDPGEVAER